jgi:acyl carrier protein
MEVIEIVAAYLQDEVVAKGRDVVLTPTTHLLEEEIIDSLGIFLVVGFIEERFGLVIDPEDVTIDNFTTLADIDAFVRAKQADAAQ